MLQLNEAELAKLQDKLQALSAKIAKKAMSKAARKAMSIVRDEVKADAPVDTGDLKANVTLRTSARKNGIVYARVGIKGGAKANPDTPYYFRMVEFGTQDMPAKPFMRPALENSAQQILDIVVRELSEALEQ